MRNQTKITPLSFRFLQREYKLCSNAFGADYIDCFVVSHNNFFYDGKSDSGACFVTTTGKVGLVESLPDFVDAVLWDSHTKILNGTILFFAFVIKLDYNL